MIKSLKSLIHIIPLIIGCIVLLILILAISDFSIFNINKTEFKMVLCVAVVEIILIIRTIFLCKRFSFKKIYIRDPKKIINPILAEAIIDRKNDIKNLVMTCLIELVNKGNLKIIDNDKVQLIKNDNLEDYEKQIIDLLFSEKEQEISFDQIKNVFIQDNLKTKEFINKFKNIKKSILKKLFDDGIYSEEGENKLKIINNLNVFILFIIFLFSFINLMPSMELLLMISPIFLAATKNIEKQKYEESVPLSIKITIGFIFAYPLSMNLLDGNMVMFISTLILLLINIINMKLVKTHIFTLKGKEEYIKAQCLKAYIEDYGLLQEKDMESTIVWEDYLAYAVAFGISNKVTDKFNENLLNLNLALQEIDKVFRI